MHSWTDATRPISLQSYLETLTSNTNHQPTSPIEKGKKVNTTYQPNFKRAVAVGIGLGILIGLLAITSVRCSESDSPVSFTPNFPDASSITSPSSSGSSTPSTPEAQPTPATPPSTDQTNAKERYNPIFNSQTGTFDVTFEHIAGTHNSGRVGVACYENPYQTVGERQIYFRSQTGIIQDAESRQVSAKIPECVYWQCDGFEGDAITGEGEIDVFYGRRLIFGRSGGPQGSCAPPPPPPPGCQPEFEFFDEVEYGEWGECEIQPSLTTQQGTRTRTKTTKTYSINSCTEETLLVNTTVEKETGPCDIECEPEFREYGEWTNVGECVPDDSDAGGHQVQTRIVLTFQVNSCDDTREFISEVEEERSIPCEPPCDTSTWRDQIASATQRCDRIDGELEIFSDVEACTLTFECTPPEPPGVCIYEYGGRSETKEEQCLALTDTAFWSDGSQHCVIPFPGVAATPWNLTPGQSAEGCLRKQDED
jgi:hypothetical protein